MGLTGALSNPEVTTRLECLTTGDRHKARPRRKAAHDSSDGRRRFGVVRDAIIHVLAKADSDLRVKDIHVGVEQLLGSPVSRSSVKNYLRKGCIGRRTPLFENRAPAATGWFVE